MRKLLGALCLLFLSSAASAQTFPGLLNLFTTPNTWTALQKFNGGIGGTLPTGLAPALFLSQTPSGTTSVSQFYNDFEIADSAALTGSQTFGVGLLVNQTFGNTVQGGRIAIQGQALLVGTTSASSSNRNYVGVFGTGIAQANDNGTNPSASVTSFGGIFGGNFLGILNSASATAFLGVTGAEINVAIITGASAWAKTLMNIATDGRDRVQGTVVDTMLWFYNQSASNPGWNNGLLFDGQNQNWPIKSTGAIIKTLGAGTAALGADFTATTFSTGAFKSTGFLVDGSGLITTGTNGGTGGQLALNGSTSGNVAINTNATASVINFTQPITVGFSGVILGKVSIFGSTSGTTVLSGTATGGHLTYVGSGTAPTNSACTGFSLTTGSSDLAGTVSFTSATSCAISFGTAFATAPFCQASGGTAATTVRVAATTSVLTVTFGTAQAAMSWNCYGA